MLKVQRSSIRIALVLFLATALLSQSSLVGAAGVPASAARSASASHSTSAPVAAWSITWATSSHYVDDDTNGAYYFRDDFTIAQSGSTLVREYADGTWDNTAFTWHVTDDWNETVNWPDISCPDLGDQAYHTWSITDPDRYTGAVEPALNVTAEQLPGGTWQVSVPFAPLMDAYDAGNTYPYTLSASGDDTECGISRPWGGTSQYKLPFKTCSLPFPAEIAGDDQGKDFTYHNTFTGLYTSPYPTDGDCQNYDMTGSTVTLIIDIAVHRLTGGILVNDESGKPVAGAQVFRNGTLAGNTDTDGLLAISDLAAGDKLVARKQILEIPSKKNAHNLGSTQNWDMRWYITSMDIPQSSEPTPLKVSNPSALQTLTLKKSNALVGFNIVVSVEWDANAGYLSELQQGFQSASDYLYDASNGQMLFERVTIYDNNQNMGDADYQVRASNQEWPRADVGGIVQNALWHVYLPRYWDGAGGNHGSWTAPYGYRTPIHEFGHYGLGLYDSYFYYDVDGIKHDSDCTSQAMRFNDTFDLNATIMDYQYNASEFSDIGVPGLWSTECTYTDQWAELGVSDWEHIASYYSDTNSPPRWVIKTPADYGGVVPGPHVQPVSGWSSVTIGNDASTGVCEPPLTYKVMDGSGTPIKGASVMLVKPTRTIDQGKTPLNGEITILGASNGDHLLVSEWGLDLNYWANDLGIATVPVACGASSRSQVADVSPTEVTLEPAPFSVYISTAPGAAADQMDITVKATTGLSAAPETSLTQNGADSAVPVSLSYDAGLQAYTGTVTLDSSLPSLGSLHVKATDISSHVVEVGSQFALNPVALDQEITVWSSDGQVELHLPAGSLSGSGRLSIAPGQMAGSTLAHLVMLSGPYTIQADQGISLINPANLSLNYLNLSGSMGNVGISSAQLYRWDGQNWQALSSTFSHNEQMVSAPITTFGTYALMGVLSYPVYLPLVTR
jgi:hypothetical protein